MWGRHFIWLGIGALTTASANKTVTHCDDDENGNSDKDKLKEKIEQIWNQLKDGNFDFVDINQIMDTVATQIGAKVRYILVYFS